MKNWLGQNIDVGSYVYRGARDGSHSSFKVGLVERLNPGKGTANVRWLVEPASVFTKDRGLCSAIQLMWSTGNPSINTLALIDSYTVGFLIGIASEVGRLKEQAMSGGTYDFPLTEKEFENYINNYARNELGRKDGYYE